MGDPQKQPGKEAPPPASLRANGRPWRRASLPTLGPQGLLPAPEEAQYRTLGRGRGVRPSPPVRDPQVGERETRPAEPTSEPQVPAPTPQPATSTTPEDVGASASRQSGQPTPAELAPVEFIELPCGWVAPRGYRQPDSLRCYRCLGVDHGVQDCLVIMDKGFVGCIYCGARKLTARECCCLVRGALRLAREEEMVRVAAARKAWTVAGPFNECARRNLKIKVDQDGSTYVYNSKKKQPRADATTEGQRRADDRAGQRQTPAETRPNNTSAQRPVDAQQRVPAESIAAAPAGDPWVEVTQMLMDLFPYGTAIRGAQIALPWANEPTWVPLPGITEAQDWARERERGDPWVAVAQRLAALFPVGTVIGGVWVRLPWADEDTWVPLPRHAQN